MDNLEYMRGMVRDEINRKLYLRLQELACNQAAKALDTEEVHILLEGIVAEEIQKFIKNLLGVDSNGPR